MSTRSESLKRREERRARPASSVVFVAHPDVGVIVLGAQSVSEKGAVIVPADQRWVGHSSRLPRKATVSPRFSRCRPGFWDTVEEAEAEVRRALVEQRDALLEELEDLKAKLTRAELRLSRAETGSAIRRVGGDRDPFDFEGGWRRGPVGPFADHDERVDFPGPEEERVEGD